MPSSTTDPPAEGPWADVAYLSAIPDFKGAPDPMFYAPSSWGWPDPAWQRAHGSWKPQPAITSPVAGYPIAILGWRFWVARREVIREERWRRLQRAARYAFFSSLFSLGFLSLVAFAFGALFPPLAILVILFAGPSALAGAIALFAVMTPMVALLDFTYLHALRRGRKGTRLFWWTLAPVVVLDLVVTQALGLIFYWSTVAVSGEEDVLSAFTLAGALLSLVATVAALVTYALKELDLQEG